LSLSGYRGGLSVGDVVDGRFELTAKLRVGGMAVIYEAIDRKYDRPAAVKVLERELAEDLEFRQRFEREAKAAQRANHPHVLPVWDHGEQSRMLYLATPLCDTDLGSLLAERGQLEPERAVAIIAQVAWALDWAHGRGVVHRDVKPENILLVVGPGDDHAYLADFGLAKATADETLTQVGSTPGLTPAYAAPEQWVGDAIGPAADQYSLAATLYTCLAGRPPYYGRRGPSLREAHLSEPPPDLCLLVEGIPEALAMAVAKGLSKNPNRRFGTCRELITTAQAGLRGPGRAPSAPGDLVPGGTGGTVSVPAVAGPPAPSASAPPPAAPSFPAPPGGATPFDTTLANEDHAAAATPPAPPQEPPAAREPEPTPSEPELAASEPTPSEPEPAASEPTRSEPELAPSEPRAPDAERLTAALVGPSAPVPVPEPGGPETVVPPAERGRRRRWAIPAAVALVVAVIAGAGAALITAGGDDSGGGGKPAGLLQLSVGPRPGDLAAGGAGVGGLWVANGDGTVSRIAPNRNQVRNRQVRALSSPAFGIAVGAGRVWVVGARGDLAELDPRTAQLVREPTQPVQQADGIAAGARAVWIVNSTAGTVTRIQTTGVTNRTSGVVVGRGTAGIAIGPKAVWVANSESADLVEIDPATGQPTRRRVQLQGGIESVAIGEGAVWVASAPRGLLFKVDPSTAELVATIRVGFFAQGADVAVGDGRVYYVNLDNGTALRIDPKTNKVVGEPVAVVPGGKQASAAAVADRALWVADRVDGKVIKLPF
jgi:outer membrane protein assembly factor BamB